ncbi:hypothetical protein ZWY2020_016307 [Hordeum vulgare]|nr:hypothetical protein ZWY2020_016307 [Hordeum vulgare]
MKGKKKARAKAAAVCVLLIVLLSAQQLPVADAASAFYRCYVSCYSDCRLRRPPDDLQAALRRDVRPRRPHGRREASDCVADGEADDADDTDAAADCMEDCRQLREARCTDHDEEDEEEVAINLAEEDMVDGGAAFSSGGVARVDVSVHGRKPDRRLSRKMAKPTPELRPWIGPLPKVNLQPISLSDFFQDWNMVKKKKISKFRPFVKPIDRQATGIAPDLAQWQSRIAFLNAACADCGPIPTVVDTGLRVPGYEAQVAGTQEILLSPLTSAAPQSVPRETLLPAPRVPYRARPGFPSLGAGRAAWVAPCAGSPLSGMAGRGEQNLVPSNQKPASQGARSQEQDKPPVKGLNFVGAEVPGSARQESLGKAPLVAPVPAKAGLHDQLLSALPAVSLSAYLAAARTEAAVEPVGKPGTTLQIEVVEGYVLRTEDLEQPSVHSGGAVRARDVPSGMHLAAVASVAVADATSLLTEPVGEAIPQGSKGKPRPPLQIVVAQGFVLMAEALEQQSV